MTTLEQIELVILRARTRLRSSGNTVGDEIIAALAKELREMIVDLEKRQERPRQERPR
jgi:hypothetical protein